MLVTNFLRFHTAQGENMYATAGSVIVYGIYVHTDFSRKRKRSLGKGERGRNCRLIVEKAASLFSERRQSVLCTSECSEWRLFSVLTNHSEKRYWGLKTALFRVR